MGECVLFSHYSFCKPRECYDTSNNKNINTTLMFELCFILNFFHGSGHMGLPLGKSLMVEGSHTQISGIEI